MSLSYNGYVVAEVRARSAHAEDGLGSHLLRVQMEIRSTIVSAESKARTGNFDFRCSGASVSAVFPGRPLFLARAHVDQGERVFTSDQPPQEIQFSLVAPLSRPQLAALEDRRAGADVTLQIRVEGEFRGPGGTRSGSVDVQIRVPASDWLVVLRDCGYQESLLIEVPVGGPGLAANVIQAAEHLRAAQSAMGHGRWRDCVGACRDVMEALAHEMKDPDDADGQWNAVFSRMRDLDLGGRMRLVRRALRTLAHPAKHVDEVAVAIEWQAEDARFALATAAAAVRWCGARRT